MQLNSYLLLQLLRFFGLKSRVEQIFQLKNLKAINRLEYRKKENVDRN